MIILHWLAVHTGIDAPGSKWYNFFSGFGSDLGEVTLLGFLFGGYRHVNCHTKGCWRIGRFPVDGTPFKVCRKCHPAIDKAPTRTQLKESHDRNNGVTSPVVCSYPDIKHNCVYSMDQGPDNRCS